MSWQRRSPTASFDFSQDYEVINDLAMTLYNRARVEPIGSAERRAFMKEAVATWRRTLELDSENVAAHYGLGLAYADLARGEDTDSLPPAHYDRRWEGYTVEEIAHKAAAAADPKAEPAQRGARARDLEATIARFLAQPRPEFHSRLDPLHGVVVTLGPVFTQETDPIARAAIASTLSATHKAMHLMFRPDETAAGRAVAIARSK